MTDAEATARRDPGWIQGEAFDSLFIVGVALVGILSGLTVLADLRLFPIVLGLDLWLLGYHHVAATFTRIAFDRESAREYHFLLFHLPWIVLAGCLASTWTIGIWTLGTTYFYWQWFHYTRQSWGISEVYRRKCPEEMEPERLRKAVLYLPPLAGILYRSSQSPEVFLGMEIRTLPVPDLLVWVVGAAAAASVIAFAYCRFEMWRRGTLPVAHTMYVASHLVVFAFGYILLENITIGWLVLNVWHNLQYVLFVRLYNRRRFSAGIDAGARILSTISQGRNWHWYFAVCLGLSTMIYLPVSLAEQMLAYTAVPAIAIYQAVNFHHYIVDASIWKIRKRKMQRTLGLPHA